MTKFCPILGTLGYVLSKDKTKVLMLHRNSLKDDNHLGKYIGLGGKIHADEDVYAAMKREIFEESGLKVEAMKLRGTMIWNGFAKNQESWLGFLFLITDYTNEVTFNCREGKLNWIPLEKLKEIPMWEGDYHFLDLVFDQEEKPFHGNMSYEGEKMKNFSYTRK